MRRDYYRGPDVLVTGECFEVMTPTPHRYRLGELAAVRVVRHGPRRAVVTSMQVAAGAVVLVGVSWSALNSVGSYLVAATLVGLPCIASGICLRLRPRVHELRARYHNCDVSLYGSADTRVFGQVRRALIRAREGVVQ